MVAIDFEAGLSEAWERIAVFVPKALGFLAILLIGYIVARVLRGLADRVLERVGLDRWVERSALAPALSRSRIDASDIVATLVFWTIFLVALQLAFGVFGPNPVSDLITGLVAYLPKVLAAVLILVIAAAVARVVTDLLNATLSAVAGGRWIAAGAGVAILVVGIFAALNQLEVAPEIVNGLFYAILAIVVGSAIVAIGGGGIQTMRRYWEQGSAKIETKGREIKQSATARERVDLTGAEAEPAAPETVPGTVPGPAPGTAPEAVPGAAPDIPPAPRPDTGVPG